MSLLIEAGTTYGSGWNCEEQNYGQNGGNHGHIAGLSNRKVCTKFGQ